MQWMRWFMSGFCDIKTTLLKNQSKFPRYNMKCRGIPDTTWIIPRSTVSRFPGYISCYIAEIQLRVPLGQYTYSILYIRS